MSWRWVTRQALELLHEESLAEHGGASGFRDEGLLESALTRPQHLLNYGEPGLCELAAALAIGVTRNHPFVDGNKRCAFLAMGLFLALNGHRLTTTQLDASTAMISLAAGEMDEGQLVDWLRTRVHPR